MEDDANVIAKLSNEFATIWLELDNTEAAGPRLRVRSMREHDEVYLDPIALDLICHIDDQVLGLLADIARDSEARDQFHAWVESVRGQLYVPREFGDGGAAEGA